MKQLQNITLVWLYCGWLFAAQAEIILDGSLGPAGVLPGPDYTINSDLGQQHGSNLFHSFSRFNLADHESATFNGSNNIQRIISRVTGGHASNIAGALNSTIANADVYLLNPAGIVFSDNAALNINGSFYASTADTLYLENGGEFNTDLTATSTLTAAPVSEFGFLNPHPAALRFQNAELNLPVGESLNLAAGDIRFHNSRINTTGSSPEHSTSLQIRGEQLWLDNSQLNSASSPDTAGGAIDIQVAQLVLQNNAQINSTTANQQVAGDMLLQADSILLTDTGTANDTRIYNITNSTGQGGNIYITAGQLRLDNGTEISTGTTSEGDSGFITVQVKGAIQLTGMDSAGEGSELSTATRGQGTAKSMRVTAGSIRLEDGAVLGGATNSNGNIGDIDIQIEGSLSLSGQDDDGSQIGIIILSNGTGGDVNIQAEQISIQDGGIMGVLSLGQGAAGDVNIRATQDIRLQGADNDNSPTAILSNTIGQGQAGALNIQAQNLYVLQGALIASLTGSSGNTGNINIEVVDTIQVDGVNAAPAELNTITDNVDADIEAVRTADTLFSSISVVTANQGDAGTITLTAEEVIISNDGAITAGAFGTGNAGNININTQRLNLHDGGAIIAVVGGEGDAGNVNIQAQQDVQISGLSPIKGAGGIVVGTTEQGKGNAGTIQIAARNLWLDNGSIIGANNQSDGNAGNIQLNLRGTLRLTGYSDTGENTGIQVLNSGSGEAGSIDITANELRLEAGAEINATAEGRGNAGNINLTIQKNIYLSGVDTEGDSSDISMQAEGDGNAGNLTLRARNLFITDGGIVGASSEGAGDAGNVDIQVADTVELRGFDGDRQSSIIGVSASGAGNAGTFSLQAQTLRLREGALILGQAIGSGQAGNISITTQTADFAGVNPYALTEDFTSNFQNQVTASSGIYAGTAAEGSGGTITLTAQQLSLTDDARISSASLSSGNGGQIFINAGTLLLDQASVIAASLGTGNAGNVQASVQDKAIINNSIINTQAALTDGGNIELSSGGYLRLHDSNIRTSINAPDGSDGNIRLDNQFITLQNSQIIAETANGEAGAIDIATQGLFIFPPLGTSEIRATSDLTIRIALERENQADFTILPSEFLTADTLLLQPCSAEQRSSFSLADYSGIGWQPEDLQNASLTLPAFKHYAQQAVVHLHLAGHNPFAYVAGRHCQFNNTLDPPA